MRISDLIKILESVKETEGDLRVTTYNMSGGVSGANERNVRVRQIREKRPRETESYYLQPYDKDAVAETVFNI